MNRPDVQIAQFEPRRETTRLARDLVADALREWDCGPLLDDAVLCVSELAANAVLHARTSYEVIVRRTGGGVRLEVLDGRPHELAVPVPHGRAGEGLPELRVTGRGLQIVAALSDRWGVITSNATKAVWAELSVETAPEEPTPPVLVLGAAPPAPRDGVHLSFRDVPVGPSVASGIQVEELIRAIQLGLADDVLDDDERRRFFSLLDRSASVRLPGRYAAFRAAAAGQQTYDFELDVDRAALSATSELEDLLVKIPLRMGAIGTEPSQEVIDLRRALGRSVREQLAAQPTNGR